MDILLAPHQKKIRVLICGGGEEEYRGSTTVRKITSGPYHGYKLVHHVQPYLPLPPDTKLKSGHVYYLGSHFRHHCSPSVYHKMFDDDDRGRGRKVKIMVTKQQLELLLRSAKQNHLKQIAAQSFWIRKGCQKWQPSLATIPEL